MHFIEQDRDNPIAVIDEYELHDLLASSQQTFIKQIIPNGSELEQILYDECGIVGRFKIEPKDPDNFNTALCRAWEDRLQCLITLMQMLDARIHEDAEYTC